MFKEESRSWLYLIGIIIMFGILIVASRDVIIPFIYGDKRLTFQINEYADRPDFDIDINRDYLANVRTNQGTITIDLYERSAPQNINNFIYLAEQGFYERTKFHRLIPNFLVQGGDRNTLDTDPKNDGYGRPGYIIEDEINWNTLDLSENKREELTKQGYSSAPNLVSFPLKRFSVAMANSGPDTNGSQFFIIISRVDDPRLEELTGKFTVIGTVVSGGEVLEKISQIPVDDVKSNIPVPSQDIFIEEVQIYTR